MADEPNNKVALEILLQTLKENPDLWETRKKTATLLFEDKRYLEAADIVWNAPTIPSTDVDVAFSLRVISRVKPNRSIRLIYEVLKRNKDKPLKNMAVARALNDAGLYMEAARFYGAALADDTSLFDLAFERQVLWLDDSGKLLDEWKKSDQESKPPLDVPEQDITGGMLHPLSLPEDTFAEATGTAQPLSAAATPGTKPLMMNSAATTQTSPLATAPAGTHARSLNAPTGGNPLLRPAATPAAHPPASQSPGGGNPLLKPAASQPMRSQTSPLSVNPLGNVPAQPNPAGYGNSIGGQPPLQGGNPQVPGSPITQPLAPAVMPQSTPVIRQAPGGVQPAPLTQPMIPAPQMPGAPITQPMAPAVMPPQSTPMLRRAPGGMQPTPPTQPMVQAMPVPTQPLMVPGMGAVPAGYPQPGIPPQGYAMPGMVPPGYPQPPQPTQPLIPGYPPNQSQPMVPPRPVDPGPRLRLQ